MWNKRAADGLVGADGEDPLRENPLTDPSGDLTEFDDGENHFKSTRDF